MNPADKFMIFFGLLDLFYDNPLDFGPIINPQFFFLYMGYFDSVVRLFPPVLLFRTKEYAKTTLYGLSICDRTSKKSCRYSKSHFSISSPA